MKQRNCGRIINLGSLAGPSTSADASPMLYDAANAAVFMMTQYLAKDWPATTSPPTPSPERPCRTAAHVRKARRLRKGDAGLASWPSRRILRPSSFSRWRAQPLHHRATPDLKWRPADACLKAAAA